MAAQRDPFLENRHVAAPNCRVVGVAWSAWGRADGALMLTSLDASMAGGTSTGCEDSAEAFLRPVPPGTLVKVRSSNARVAVELGQGEGVGGQSQRVSA